MRSLRSIKSQKILDKNFEKTFHLELRQLKHNLMRNSTDFHPNHEVKKSSGPSQISEELVPQATSSKPLIESPPPTNMIVQSPHDR